MKPIKAKLLIVDDEPLVVEIISKLLRHCGYDVKTASDGEEAVLIAKQFHPDCVVTGFVMPRMDGLQEAAAILQFQPSCKFVFVTSNAHDPTVREEYERLSLDFNLLLSQTFPAVRSAECARFGWFSLFRGRTMVGIAILCCERHWLAGIIQSISTSTRWTCISELRK